VRQRAYALLYRPDSEQEFDLVQWIWRVANIMIQLQWVNNRLDAEYLRRCSRTQQMSQFMKMVIIVGLLINSKVHEKIDMEYKNRANLFYAKWL